MPKDTFSPEPDFETLREVLGDLAERPAFLVWRAYPQGDGFSKIPVDPKDGVAREPNAASDRGILTLSEAEAQWKYLADAGLPVGVGVYPPHLGSDYAALDLDDCVKRSGGLQDWAAAVVADLYFELSPSGKGIRALVRELPEDLAERSAGYERGSIGIYGHLTRKFTTLTGNAQSDVREIKPFAKSNAGAIWNRWAAVGSRSYSSYASDYALKDNGLERALNDIRTGAALHPATVGYVSVGVNAGLSLLEIEENLHEAYQESAVKESIRWNARYPSSINGVLYWMRGKAKTKGAKSGVNPLLEMPTQTWQARAATVRRVLAERDAPRVQKPAEGGRYTPPVDHELAPLFGSVWADFDEEEVAEVEKMAVDEPDTLLIYADGLRGGILISPACEAVVQMLEERTAESVDAAERDRILKDFDEQDAEAVADYSLIEAIPESAFKEIVGFAYNSLEHETPELALMATITGVGAAATGYIVRTKRYNTSLNAYCASAASSGIGKSFIETAVNQIMASVGLSVSGLSNSAEGIHRTALEAAEHGKTDGRGRTSASLIFMSSEFEGWLKKAQADVGSEPAAMKFLLELYSNAAGANGFIKPVSRADKRHSRPRVNNPAVSVGFFLTEDGYFSALTQAMVTSGWGNRALNFIIDYDFGDARPYDFERPDDLPQHLKDALAALEKGAMASIASNPASQGFWTASEDWHRWFRVLRPSDEAQRKLHAEVSRFRKRFADEGLEPAIAARLGENVLKLAGQMAALEHAADAVALDEWQTGELPVDDAFVDYAIFAVSKLLHKFAKKWHQRSGSSIEAEMGQQIMAEVKHALRNPKSAYKRKGWEAAIRDQGWVPVPYIKHKMRANKTVRDGLDWLEAADEIEVSTVGQRPAVKMLSKDTVLIRPNR